MKLFLGSLCLFGKYQTCMVFDSVPTLLPFLIDFSLKKEGRIKKKKIHVKFLKVR
jgi:hypothetical protein